jgi:general secretion pathway protein D
MVQSLDKPTAAGGNLHVVFLKNAEAVRVAQTLRAVLSGESSPALNIAATAPLSTAPSADRAATGLRRTRPVAVAAQRARLRWAAGSGIVQADPASNAVIISAPGRGVREPEGGDRQARRSAASRCTWKR